ncbi:MAG: protein-L-isoaspartate O-methyltransferase [Methylobacterium sp.]
MDFAAARTKMVDNQIRTTDVTSHEILRAFLSVPRERFVPAPRQPLAYIDEDIPLGGGRFLMEPSPFAKLLQLAQVGPGDVVLDVGCGTGYSSAVLSHLGGSVVALEEDASLAGQASETLDSLGIVSCAVVVGSLVEGVSSEAPFDVIVFQGAVEEIPSTFFDQLKDRGRLVVVEGYGLSAMAKLYTKEDGIVSDRFGFNCSVKPLPGFARRPSFVF